MPDGSPFASIAPGLDELPLLALVPGATSIDVAVVAFAGQIIEKLIDEPGGRRDWPIANGGFSMLSSARVKALMCVISRVIRNCSASLLPASSQKLMRRS